MKKIVLAVLTLLLSCDITENRFITIINESDNEVYSFVTTKDIVEGDVNALNDISVEIKQEDSNTINPVRIKWDDYIKKCNSGKMRLYIIKKDSVDKYGWKGVYKMNVYNKKYLFTISDLEKLNWEIKFK